MATTGRQQIRDDFQNEFTASVADDPEGYIANVRLADLGQRNRVLFEGRIPIVLTCLSWQARGRAIEFWVNPREVTWNFPIRGTTIKVKGGTVSYTWRDASRGSTFYDEPRMGITFQTGNASPVYDDRSTSGANSGIVKVPPGVMDLYDFIELGNEPLVLDDGSMNYRIIAYNSVLFPELFLYGFFDLTQELSFSENADDPAQTTWNQTFIVRRSIPNYTNAAALAKTFALRAEEYLAGTGTQQSLDAQNDLKSVFDSGSGALVPSSFSDPIMSATQPALASDAQIAQSIAQQQAVVEKIYAGQKTPQELQAIIDNLKSDNGVQSVIDQRERQLQATGKKKSQSSNTP